jgi:hypothetical protein
MKLIWVLSWWVMQPGHMQSKPLQVYKTEAACVKIAVRLTHLTKPQTNMFLCDKQYVYEAKRPKLWGVDKQRKPL